MAAPPETLSLCKVLSESKRIIRLHPHHFQALAGLFVLPLSICYLLYPIIQRKLLPHSKQSFLSFDQPPYGYLLFTLLWSLFSNVLNLFPVATFSYSTYHFSLGETVDLISSIKSVLHSFWPLVSTTLVLVIINVLITIPFVLLMFSAFKWLQHSSYFIPSVILLTLILVVVLIYLQVNWILANVVAVVESRWGYAPLQRSAYLVKGNRGVALSMLLYFGLLNGSFLWGYYGSSWGGWQLLLYMILGCFYLTLVLPLCFIAITVLYAYCRESHEGLPFDNPKKFPLLE